MVNTAFIHIHNKRAAAVLWDPNRGVASFEYEPGFLDSGLDLSPFKMPLSLSRGRIYSFPELRDSQTFRGLPGLLADVLPDRYGHSLINAWLSKNGRPANSMNPVELLCFIGQRGMGALEFEPIVPTSTDTSSLLELDGLISIAQEILSGRKDFSSDLSASETKAVNDIFKIGTSAGGARAKAVIAYNPVSGEIRSGQTKVPKGFSHWLIKFDGVSDLNMGSTQGYGRVEMAYHLMARAAEIEMSECRLLEEGGRAHFMTRRFDRDDQNKKIHYQSFCAIRHYDFNEILSYSYEELFETMRGLLLPYSAAEQMYRRMVFNVMSRNCDDHTKNFAFLMTESGEWKLAPAFDLCHAYRPDSTWVSQHSLSINGKRKNITRNDLLQVAENMNIKKAKEIIDQVHNVVVRWKEFAEETKVDSGLRDRIQETMWLV